MPDARRCSGHFSSARPPPRFSWPSAWHCTTVGLVATPERILVAPPRSSSLEFPHCRPLSHASLTIAPLMRLAFYTYSYTDRLKLSIPDCFARIANTGYAGVDESSTFGTAINSGSVTAERRKLI